MTAIILGLMDRIDVVDADTMSRDDSLRRQNPLGKIPTLILENGRPLFDSRVIVEYLDDLAGGNILIPKERDARFAALTLQALADGVQDAAVVQRYEIVFRDEPKREPKWLAHQAEKVERTLAVLNRSPPGGACDIGHIAVACALGYLDLRFEGKWRRDYPNLVSWLDALAAKTPAFEATRFTPPT